MTYKDGDQFIGLFKRYFFPSSYVFVVFDIFT